MKANHAHISFLLDRSGSMADIATDTIDGFNAFLSSQKAAPGTATVTLAQFDNQSHDTVYAMRAIGEAPELTSATFIPRGGTPLLDSMMQIIDDTGAALKALPEDQRPTQTYIVILTDGLENSSFKHSREAVMAKVKHQESVYKWQFVYLGSNQDAIAVGQGIGISAAAAVSYQPSAKGIRAAYAVASAGVARARGVAVAGAPVSFTAEEREDAINPSVTDTTAQP